MTKDLHKKIPAEDRPYPSFNLSEAEVSAFIKQSPFYYDELISQKVTDPSGSNGNSKKAKKGIFALGKEAKQKRHGPETKKALRILKRISSYK